MIELLATLTLFSILVGMGVPLLNLLLDAYWMTKVTAPATSAGALAMERMVREIRMAHRNSLQVENSSLTFSSPEGSVRLHQTRPGDAGIYLVKNGEERILMRSAAAGSLSFSLLPPAPGLVEIAFTVTTPLADGSPIQSPWATAVHVAP